VRAHLKAELVTAPTASAALSALGDRIPDLVLTPALFGMKDEAALTERLRQLGSHGSHVQTLAIPILASGASRGGNGGLLGRGKKDKNEGDVGCDPAVFAEQIRIYLQRAAVERRAQVSEAAARAMTSAPASAPASDTAPDLPPFMVSADELDVDSLDLSIPTLEPTPQAPAPPAAAAKAAGEDDRGAKQKQSKAKPSPVEEELGLVTPPAAGPPLWRVAESIEDFYGDADAFNAAAATTPASDAGATTEPAVAASFALPAASPANSAPAARRTPPQPDDWAYFDASQSAFKALTRRLDEIAGSAA
jgi:hypothetical protein